MQITIAAVLSFTALLLLALPQSVLLMHFTGTKAILKFICKVPHLAGGTLNMTRVMIKVFLGGFYSCVHCIDFYSFFT